MDERRSCREVLAGLLEALAGPLAGYVAGWLLAWLLVRARSAPAKGAIIPGLGPGEPPQGGGQTSNTTCQGPGMEEA